MLKAAISSVFCVGLVAAADLEPQVTRVLAKISATSLLGHVSFLSSDLLQGRDTPSPGLEIAGEYVASEFRRSGLEAAGDDGFFQTAQLVSSTPNLEGFNLEYEEGGKTVHVPSEAVSVRNFGELRLSRAKVFKVFLDSDAPLELTGEQVTGKVLLAGSRRMNTSEALWLIQRAAARLKPAVILLITQPSLSSGPLLDLERAESPLPPLPVVVQLQSDELMDAYDALNAGDTPAVVSLYVAARKQEPVILRNVAGLLRGSDAQLKDEYVLVTAHYDHIGVAPRGEGDRIFNGADDNASGTAAVIELADALSTMNPRPKRSILFLAFFGEEKGLLGSRYYIRNPLVPLRNTVASINLEVLGRTDDTEGPQISKLSVTGHGYSEVADAFLVAGKLTGVEIPNRKQSDDFFRKSDNLPFAQVGIPAHTAAAVYLHPDIHSPRDEWLKLDYQNMAALTRTVACAVRMIADGPNAPKWNEANPKAAPFIKAAKERR
jgi:hypothetical protein